MRNILITFSLFLSQIASSQTLEFDSGFRSEFIGATIGSSAVQSNGKIIVLGSFFGNEGYLPDKIMRLNSDGSRDFSFNMSSPDNGVVFSIALDENDRILVGGTFTSYAGINRNYIARLNTDGSIDPSFNANSVFNNGTITFPIINDIKSLSDGNIIIGGDFRYSYLGNLCVSLAKLNENGSLNHGFDFNWTGDNLHDRVIKFFVLPDNSIITSSAGFQPLRFFNSNGSFNNEFNRNGFFGQVNDLIVDNGGNLLIAGFLKIFGDEQVYLLMKLLPNGLIDPDFNKYGHDISSNANHEANSLVLFNNKIILGGLFSQFSETQSRNLIAFNLNGTIDSTYQNFSGFDNKVRSLAIVENNKVLVTGNFWNYKNSYQSAGICKLVSSGLSVSNFTKTNVIVSRSHDGYVVFSNADEIVRVDVYDVFGRLVGSSDVMDKKVFIDKTSDGQILIFRVVVKSGAVFVVKVLS